MRRRSGDELSHDVSHSTAIQRQTTPERQALRQQIGPQPKRGPQVRVMPSIGYNCLSLRNGMFCRGARSAQARRSSYSHQPAGGCPTSITSELVGCNFQVITPEDYRCEDTRVVCCCAMIYIFGAPPP